MQWIAVLRFTRCSYTAQVHGQPYHTWALEVHQARVQLSSTRKGGSTQSTHKLHITIAIYSELGETGSSG